MSKRLSVFNFRSRTVAEANVLINSSRPYVMQLARAFGSVAKKEKRKKIPAVPGIIVDCCVLWGFQLLVFHNLYFLRHLIAQIFLMIVVLVWKSCPVCLS